MRLRSLSAVDESSEEDDSDGEGGLGGGVGAFLDVLVVVLRLEPLLTRVVETGIWLRDDSAGMEVGRGGSGADRAGAPRLALVIMFLGSTLASSCRFLGAMVGGTCQGEHVLGYYNAKFYEQFSDRSRISRI